MQTRSAARKAEAGEASAREPKPDPDAPVVPIVPKKAARKATTAKKATAESKPSAAKKAPKRLVPKSENKDDDMPGRKMPRNPPAEPEPAQAMPPVAAAPVAKARSGVPPPLELKDVWAYLEEGVKIIYNGEKLTVPEYMNYYSKVHDYCANSPQQAARKQPKTRSGGAEFAGCDLYERLKKYLSEYVGNIQKELESLQSEDDLLAQYAKQWQSFAFSSKVLDGLFRYLNRHWIKREKDEGNKNVHEVYVLCLYMWKSTIFTKENSESVAQAAIRLIARDRNGEKIQDELIKNMVDSLEQLGLEDGETDVHSNASGQNYGRPCPKDNPGYSDEQKKRLRVYLETFEEKLLNITDVYYTEEAEQYLQNHSIVEYMVKVETRLKEEEERVRRYLNMYSMVRISHSLETMFISHRLPKLQSEFGALLAQDRDNDLTRLFNLCSRVTGALDSLRAEFQEFFRVQGEKAISELENIENADPDPKTYISTILKVHKRYDDLVSAAFQRESGFVQAFDIACNKFINKNKVTQRHATVNKSAELLARYTDTLLKKGGLKAGDEDIENHLNYSMTVFKYVDDKDIFQKFYIKMLAKRLTTDTSASEDAESSLISKLKSMCGFEYTNKIQRMFTDIGLSRTLNENFQRDREEKKYAAKENLPSFDVKVLGSGSWPINQNITFPIPHILQKCTEMFQTFYASKHQGRKLIWIYNMSRGEVQTNYFARKYTLTTTTAQMAVLLKYNTALSYSYKALKSELDQPKEILLAVVQSFVKAGLLKLPEGVSFSASLPDDTQLELNKKFASKKMKIDIARMQVAKIEAKQDAEAIEKTIEEDRKMLIQACIVRIMKMRKRVNHTALITEVIEQISSRFAPKVPMVKKCIDILMEKEYMKRVDGEKDLYEYIS